MVVSLKMFRMQDDLFNEQEDKQEDEQENEKNYMETVYV